MKFDNLKQFKTIITGVLLGAILTGCATSGGRSAASSTSGQSLAVKNTSQYVPQRQVSEETGAYLPYAAQLNPYTELKGKIDKASVINFIDAKRAVKNKQYKQAKSILSKMVAADQKLSGPWVLLGDIAKLKQENTQAVGHYKKAIQVNHKNVNVYLKLAKLERELGRFVEAQNTYEKALSTWKDFPEAHLNLAVLYDVYLNQPLKAQRHMEAYQFLTQGKNKTVGMWLSEIQQRTGAEISLSLESKPASQVSLSAQGNSTSFTKTVN